MRDEAISKSALAKLLKCSPGAITKVCQHGGPTRPDGRLNKFEFLKHLAGATSGIGGGWGGGFRGPDLATRAAAILEGKAAPPKADASDTEAEASGLLSEPTEREAVQAELLDCLRAHAFRHLPQIVLELVEAVRGCGDHAPMVAAQLAAETFEALLLSVEDIAPAYDWKSFPGPDYVKLAKRFGLPVDRKLWEAQVEAIGLCMGDLVSALGLWGPICQRAPKQGAAAGKKRTAAAK